MSGNLKTWSKKRGCDTTYRASSLDTHLTHLCMPVFSQYLRVRSGCALRAQITALAFQRLYEGAIRTLGGERS